MGNGATAPRKEQRRHAARRFRSWVFAQKQCERDRDRYLHARVYSSITHKSENGGSNPRAADGGGDAQDVAGAHSGLSPSLGKAQKAEECDAGPRETLCRVR